jgi:hypothetical protein
MVLFSNLCHAPRVRQFAPISLSALPICEVPRLGLLFRTGAHTDSNASTVPDSTTARACRFSQREYYPRFVF